MFGSATDYLAILGCCSIIFCIICFLKYLSKSASSKIIRDACMIFGYLFALLTIVPSLIFAIPIQLLCKECKQEGYNEAQKKTIEIDEKILKAEVQKSYDNGLEYGMWLANPDVSVLFIEIHWLLESYRGIYEDYKNGTPFSDVKEEYIKPEHFFHEDLPNGNK